MKKQKKIIVISFVIASILCIIGATMKIHHVAFANSILTASILAGFTFIVLLIYYFCKSKA
jgi:hypothetical protein